ncbi:MAG: hypothetical protein KA224_04555 [Steroidobacteraceae bacterium]|nr:hypothetical protein [Steroidobacteraceae bacterium]
MRIRIASLLAIAALASACGGEPEPAAKEEPPPRVRTFADDTIGVKDKAQQRTEAAMETHREALQQRLQEDEGGTPPEPPAE